VEHDDKANRDTIIITELPYQLNKARLIERIAELVKEKKIEGITELRDESDKDGMRVVIELRRGDSGEVVLNNLYAQTQLQTVFGINCVALEHGQPKVLNLKQMLEAFVRSTAARWSPAAPSTCCARPGSAATSSKARRWRWPTSTRSSS
jgi:DNA gyrase subunit A